MLRHVISGAVLARARVMVMVAERGDELLPPEPAGGDAWAEDTPEGASILGADGVIDERVDGAIAA